MVSKVSIDVVKTTMKEQRKKAEQLVDVNTIKHTDAREIGAEWVCLQAIRELETEKFATPLNYKNAAICSSEPLAGVILRGAHGRWASLGTKQGGRRGLHTHTIRGRTTILSVKNEHFWFIPYIVIVI